MYTTTPAWMPAASELMTNARNPDKNANTDSSTKTMLTNLNPPSKKNSLEVALQGCSTGFLVALSDILCFPPYGLRYVWQMRNAAEKPLSLNELTSLRVLFRGVIPYSAGSFPTFLLQNYIFISLENSYPHLNSPYYNAFFAITAGVIGAATATPAGNIIVTQHCLKLQKLPYSPYDAFKSLQHQGYTRFFRGGKMIMMRDGIYAGSMYSIVNLVRAKFKILFGMEEGLKLDLMANLVTGIVSSLTSQPADTIATKMHANNNSNASLIDTAREIIHKEGLKALWKGGVFRASALTLSGYLGSSAHQYGKKLWNCEHAEEKTINSPRKN